MDRVCCEGSYRDEVIVMAENPKAGKKEKAKISEKQKPQKTEKTRPLGKSGSSGQAAAEKKKEKQRPAVKAVEGFDPWRVLVHPHMTEKSMGMVEPGNKLVFMVTAKAKKADVKAAIEKGFGAAVESVNITNTKTGKKAFVRLHKSASAADIATRLGMI